MAEARFSQLEQAMVQAASLVEQHWQAVARRLLTSAHEREAYVGAIAVDDPPVVSIPGGLRSTVRNTFHAARALEYGHRAFHLPSRINWGRSKARRTRAGRSYLIIAFRHDSAPRGIRAQAASATARRNMLPRPVYNVARRLQRGQYLTAGESRGRAVHAPGLRPYVPSFAPNIRPGYTHAALQERLIRSTRSRRGTSTYLTFRTLTQDAPGWWIPARAPRAIAATTLREVTPQVRQLLEAASVQDISMQVSVALEQGGAA